MRFQCTHCSQTVKQSRNPDGPNFCPKCHKLFYVPAPQDLPPWIQGVLVFLTANWQIMLHR